LFSFPNLATTELLLSYGRQWIDVNAVDILSGNTALHFVCQSTHTDALPIVKLLINAGAHVDCLNKQNKAPVDSVKITPIKNLLQTYQKPSLLKCRCARYIVAHDLNYELIWPAGTKLNSFLYLHGRIGKLIEEKKQ
jgi:ankyrin repeat protein